MAIIPDEPEAIQIQKQRENFIVKKVIEQGSLLEILRICMCVCMYVRVGFRMHIFLFACNKLQIKRKYNILYYVSMYNMYVCMYVCMSTEKVNRFFYTYSCR